jgi:hypothetical protein
MNEQDERPGVLAWVVIATGWGVMTVAVVGALGDEALRAPASWVRWMLGVALVHDLVVIPVVVAVGWLVARWVPAPWRVPLRTALIVGACTTLAVWPIARRWGARADNPSILPLPVGRNLVLMWALLAVAVLVAGAVRRHAAPPPSLTGDVDHGTAP